MKINKPLIIKIILVVLSAVIIFVAGAFCLYYYEERQAEKEELLKEQKNIEKRKQFGINVGGFKPYMSGKEAIDLAVERGYDYSIENSHMNIKGGVSAFGIVWDDLNCLLKTDRGIVDIVLTTKASELSGKDVMQCIEELKRLFPRGKILPDPEFNITVGDKTIPVLWNNVDLFLESDGLFVVSLTYRKEKDELFCFIAPN